MVLKMSGDTSAKECLYFWMNCWDLELFGVSFRVSSESDLRLGSGVFIGELCIKEVAGADPLRLLGSGGSGTSRLADWLSAKFSSSEEIKVKMIFHSGKGKIIFHDHER